MKPETPPKAATLLIIGSRGMLARDLAALLSRAGFETSGLDMPDIDITQHRRSFDRIASVSPRIVINCAAYTAVDKAESDPETALAVNRDGSGNLARICRKLSIPLIHVSTDYVFDGASARPYREDDRANPLGVYGKSKWEGEEAIRAELSEHIIVRTAWMFGEHGHNFVKAILRLAKEREELRVVADQHGCPTWSKDLGEALTRIAERILTNREGVKWGAYHYCGTPPTTWHGFAEAILSEAREHKIPIKASRIIPLETKDYPTPAFRPKNSVLDCTKIATHFGIRPGSWRGGLREVIRS